MLRFLDDFEDCPESYQRDKIIVVHEATSAQDSAINKTGIYSAGQKSQCWCYFCKDFTEEDLQEECYSDYDSYGSHGKPYKTESVSCYFYRVVLIMQDTHFVRQLYYQRMNEWCIFPLKKINDNDSLFCDHL